MITNLVVENFRSLSEIDVSLGRMNFVVGPNASGKSNFVAALDFLSHVANENLQYAVAECGGFSNMINRRRRPKGGTGISFKVSGSMPINGSGLIEYKFNFEIRTRSQEIRADFFVASEQLYFRITSPDSESGEFNVYREGDERNQKYAYGVDGAPFDETFKSWVPNLFDQGLLRPEPQGLLLASFFSKVGPFGHISSELQSCGVFQLNPRIARQPSAPSVSGNMGRRGENLASALDRMRSMDKAGFDTLSEWIRDVLPSLTHLITDYTDSRQLGLFFQEDGFTSRWFAEDISDGTIMSLALFFALLDKRHKTVIIEEPENTLHPWVLKKFLQHCREQDSNRQILITTHSPIVVAHAQPDELYLMERHNGVSSMKRATIIEPNLSEIIVPDLLDLGQYWMSGGLGAVPSTPETQEGELF
jgi:predicted ATPase